LSEIFEAQGKNRWKVALTTAKERIEKLMKLRKAILERQEEFYKAVWEDFHKPKTEAWLSEVYPTLTEIDYTVGHLPDWMEDKDGSWSLLFPTNQSVSHFEPKGRVLIMAPWNYPFLLFLSPIVAAIAAGNVIMAKPSHKTPKVSAFLESLMSSVFDIDELAVIHGAGTEVGDQLLAMWRSRPETFRRKQSKLYMSADLVDMYADWYEAKYTFVAGVGESESHTKFLRGTAGKCEIVPVYGLADQSQFVILTTQRNMCYGFDKESDMKTVLPFNSGNPYWFTMAGKYVFGTQFASIHKSEFCVNDRRLAPAYIAVTSPSGNPKTQGWYVKSGNDYVATTDTTVQQGTTYYAWTI